MRRVLLGGMVLGLAGCVPDQPPQTVYQDKPEDMARFETAKQYMNREYWISGKNPMTMPNGQHITFCEDLASAAQYRAAKCWAEDGPKKVKVVDITLSRVGKLWYSLAVEVEGGKTGLVSEDSFKALGEEDQGAIWQKEKAARIAKGDAKIGMTMDQVLNRSVWGKPDRVQVYESASGHTESWVYEHDPLVRGWLTFRNGRLTRISY